MASMRRLYQADPGIAQQSGPCRWQHFDKRIIEGMQNQRGQRNLRRPMRTGCAL